MKRIPRPALDYFGGKWKHAQKIIEIFPEHKTFVDAFCGAASVTLRKPRSKNEIINDINQEVTEFFEVLRDRNAELKEALSKTPYSREEYYRCRPQSPIKLENARRIVVRSWFGIGDSLDNKTGFRVSISQGGSCTQPWLNYVDWLHVYAERMRGVIIENLDYKELIKRYDRPNTLFYFDPPYLIDTRSKKHAYKYDWNDFMHEEFIAELKNIKGKFIISGYNSGIYKSLPYKKKTYLGITQSRSREETLWIKEI